MSLLQTEGIILHALDFKDYDQILTVFTHEHGVVKFLVKGAKSFKRKKGTSTAPLTRGDFIYRQGNSDLLLCREISVVDLNLKLRNNLRTLEVSCEIAQAIQKSQLHCKPTPDLYQLLIRYFENIPLISTPEVLGTSFLLKLLRHDGHLGSTLHCSVCHTCLSKCYLINGEAFCSQHAPPHALSLSEEEHNCFRALAFSRSISELQNLSLPLNFENKVRQFFEDVILLA